MAIAVVIDVTESLNIVSEWVRLLSGIAGK